MHLLTRLLLYVLTPFLIGSVAILLTVGYRIENILRSDIAEAANNAMRLQVHAVEKLLATHRQSLRILSTSRVLAGGDTAAIIPQLAAWQKQAQGLDGLYFVTIAGIGHDAYGHQFEISNRPYFELIRRGESALTAPLVSRATGHAVVLAIEPVKSSSGRLIGAVIAGIPLERIDQALQALKPTASALAALTDTDGNLLTAPNNDGDAQATAAKAVAAAIKDGKQQPFVVALPQSGERREVFHTVIPATGWHLALAYPEDETHANVALVWQMGSWIILALAISAIIAVAVFNHWLLYPVGRLANALARLESGESNVRIGAISQDELGQLSSAFDRMAEQLDNALQAARAAEQKFRALFENANDAIFLITGDRFIACNPFTERMFRCTQEQLLATGPIDMSPDFQPDGRPSREAGEAYSAAALAGEPQYFSWKHRTSDGNLFDVEVCLSRIELDNQVMLQAIVRDISARMQAKARETALETRFGRVFQASPDSMIVAQVEGGLILEINEGFERLTGYSRAEAIGKTVREINLSASQDERSALVERLRKDGIVQNFSGELRRRDGTLRHVSLSAATFTYNDVNCYVSITRDITDEKLVQKALIASEARLKTIFELAPIPIAINRVSDFTYVAVNPAHERVFGYPSQSIIGKSIREAGILFLSDNTLRQQTRKLMTDGEIDNASAVAVNKSGKRVHFIYSSRIIELDNEPVIISMSTDVSRLKEVEDGLRETEEALRESETRFVTLFQSSPAALGVFDDGKRGFSTLQVNDAWFNTFRYSAEEVIGRPSNHFGLWIDEAERDKFMARIAKDGEVKGFQSWLRRCDGEALLCSVSGRLITVGRHRLLLAAYIDITQQHKAEESLRHFNATLENRIQERTSELQQAQAELMRSEKLAALGSLVAGVAHELNTPIGTCLTVATTLVDHTATIRKNLPNGLRRSELEAYLADAASGTGILARNLQRAAELIQSFKSIAVDQASDQQRRFDLRKIIEETLVALRPSLKNSTHALQIEIPDALSMNSYPGPLEQVVVNLVNNAILHGLEGRSGGTVEIGAEVLENDWVRITVADNGRGIPEASLNRVFDPFFTTKLGKGGSGLGLHIVRNIVEDVLGGRIRVESILQAGTTMIIEIPRTATPLVAPDVTGTE
ncbi:MAG: PAS domain S-box protein [Betaproteobacteria bacterium]